MTRAVLAFALVALATLPARAGVPVVVAGPGGTGSTYAPTVVVHQAGDALTLVNADAALHTLISTAHGSDDQPWCGPLNPGPESPTNPRRYPRGSCPLFWSDFALPLGGRATVYGLDQLVPGKAYPFACRVFGSMSGVIITQ